MPFVFTIAGVLLVVSGVRGTSTDLFKLVKSDFSGTHNYFEYIVAVFLVGSIGYVKELSTMSRLFMFLIIAGLLYQNKQFFSGLVTQETAQPVAQTNPSTAPISNGLPVLPTLPTISTRYYNMGN